MKPSHHSRFLCLAGVLSVALFPLAPADVVAAEVLQPALSALAPPRPPADSRQPRCTGDTTAQSRTLPSWMRAGHSRDDAPLLVPPAPALAPPEASERIRPRAPSRPPASAERGSATARAPPSR